jgi:hypothetical protein
MSNKKKATPLIPKSELTRFGVDYATKDFEKGLREIDELPDGHRKRWILAVKKNKDDAEILMGELRRHYPDLEWPEQLPRLGVQYHDVVPILLHWLPRTLNPDIRASIAKALGQRWLGRVGVEAIAASIAATLRELPPSGGINVDIQSMINSLITAADADDLLRVAEVGLDPKMPGTEKGLLIFLLGRRRSSSGAAALIALMKGATEQHLVEITNELLKNRTEVARKFIEGLKEHPVASVRELAKSGRFTKS